MRGQAARHDEGDFNFNGVFDSDDLIEAFATGEYDAAGGAAAVPEPSTLVLFAFAIVGILTRRLRTV